MTSVNTWQPMPCTTRYEVSPTPTPTPTRHEASAEAAGPSGSQPDSTQPRNLMTSLQRGQFSSHSGLVNPMPRETTAQSDTLAPQTSPMQPAMPNKSRSTLCLHHFVRQQDEFRQMDKDSAEQLTLIIQQLTRQTEQSARRADPMGRSEAHMPTEAMNTAVTTPPDEDAVSTHEPAMLRLAPLKV